MENDVILSVKDLEVEFITDDGPVKVLHGSRVHSRLC